MPGIFNFRFAAGVTIVEMVALLAILSVLAILAAQQYKFLRARAQESALRGKMGSIRGALLIYYGDTGGTYPAHLADLAAKGKYIDAIPKQDIPAVASTGNPGHKIDAAAEEIYAAMPASPADFRNEGSALWGYMNTPRKPGYGHAFVNCQHRDSKSELWTHW